jgi:putative transposase
MLMCSANGLAVFQNLALRVRLYPTDGQEAFFGQIGGCARLVYNTALEQRSTFWRQYQRAEGRSLSWYTQKAELPALKQAAPYLKDVPAHCLQMALFDLNAAFRNFFEGRAGYPRPRRRYEHDRFRFPDRNQIRLDSRRGLLYLPKCGYRKGDHGPIRCRLHRRIKGSLRSVTIVRDGNHWYASILYRVKVDTPEPVNDNLAPEEVIGVDCGVAAAFMTSNGEAFGHAIEPPLRSGRARRGRRLWQQLARCRKGSKRRMRARARLAAFKAREKRQRKDMIEQASARIARKGKVVVLEDLQVRSMTASARGTVADPGRNVAAKAGLNRVILDKGWGMFRIRLGQKLVRNGGVLLTVPAGYTSQRCHACGHVAAASRTSQERFVCVSCGHMAHADHNAALNIRLLGLMQLGLADPDGLAAGTAVTARGAYGVSRAAKREFSLGDGGAPPEPASSGCLAA